MGEVLIIGIAGGSGSGKTTLTNRIAAQFEDEIAMITHDNYYKAYSEMTFEKRCEQNYDHPNAFDTSLLVEHLKLLKEGQAIECPVYDYKAYTRCDYTTRIEPKKVIIVEGILIFENKELCEQMDIRIFVDTDDDIRIIRRIRRDVVERARSLDSVIDQYIKTVKPMYEQFVEPSKKNASIIVPEGGHNVVAVEMILNHIRNHIASYN